jgi:F-type H+-transporting ATPase subunit b
VRNRLTSSAVDMRRMRSSWLRGIAAGFWLTLVSGLIAQPVLASDDLVLVPNPKTLTIMLAGFVLLIFPLNQLIFKPIFRLLDERSERISGVREHSNRLESQADGALERYQTAIREARGESEVARQRHLTEAREEQAASTARARGEAESDLERAREDLGRSLEEARASIRSSAEDLAQTAAEQVLGRALS